MSRLSHRQRARRLVLNQQMWLGLFPPARYSQLETTKETVYNHSDDRIREGSPHGVAAPSRSSRTREEKRDLLRAARSVFPARHEALCGVDVHGRRSPIDTSRMSGSSYQALLAAAGMSRESGEVKGENPAPRELAPGFVLGPKTGLAIPDWWKLPKAGASAEQVKATMLENLQQVQERRRGTSSGPGWGRAL